MNITGNNVVLRALEPEDMPFLQDMINDPEMEYMVIGVSIQPLFWWFEIY